MTMLSDSTSRLLAVFIATLVMIASMIPSSAASNARIVFKSGLNSTNGIWVMNTDG